MFYITLPSNSSMKTFPGNTVTHFTTQLPRPIELTGHWECGLVEFQYPHSWVTVRGTEVYMEIKFQGRRHRFSVAPGHYPRSKRLCQGLMEALQNSATPDSHALARDITIYYDEEKYKYHLEITKDMHVSFSPRLKELTGFEDVMGPVSVSQADRYGDIQGGMGVLFVYCDVVEGRVVGDTLAPLLHTVVTNPKHYGRQVTKEFQQVQYVPVQKKTFSTVEIDIRSDTGQPVPFEHGRVVATLHFRRTRSPEGL